MLLLAQRAVGAAAARPMRRQQAGAPARQQRAMSPRFSAVRRAAAGQHQELHGKLAIEHAAGLYLRSKRPAGTGWAWRKRSRMADLAQCVVVARGGEDGLAHRLKPGGQIAIAHDEAARVMAWCSQVQAVSLPRCCW